MLLNSLTLQNMVAAFKLPTRNNPKITFILYLGIVQGEFHKYKPNLGQGQLTVETIDFQGLGMLPSTI